jgi:hypothetical protein
VPLDIAPSRRLCNHYLEAVIAAAADEAGLEVIEVAVAAEEDEDC